MKTYRNIYDKIIDPVNLFESWTEFLRGKKGKTDVQKFEYFLEQNIFSLHSDLVSKRYRHGRYAGFCIHDPKLRHIHKATVRDRVLHHAVFRVLNPIFEETFIPTSFSCRVGYGTHKGVAVLEGMLWKMSRNGTRPCFALKCDIKKFFDSVDHEILLATIKKRIKDYDAMWLIRKIIGGYASQPREREREVSKKGIPIGNLTSQLFANIYLNEFDQFVKHELRVKHYVRYTDDFIIAADNTEYLQNLLPPIADFLKEKLRLELHPQKIIVRKLSQGVDFLGYVIFPKHRLIRTKTRKRIFERMRKLIREYRREEIGEKKLNQTVQSYLGVLSHAKSHKLSEYLKNMIWFES